MIGLALRSPVSSLKPDFFRPVPPDRHPRRRQDLLDVVELINAGADVRRVRQYLKQYGGDLLAVFDELVEEAVEG